MAKVRKRDGNAKRGKNSHTHPDRLATRERDLRCFELRRDGHSLSEVARIVGLNSPQSAANHIERAYKLCYNEPAEKIRKLAYARLMRMLTKLKPGIDAGDPDACSVALRLEARIAKMYGLDSPQKVEHSGKDGEPIQTQSVPPEQIQTPERLKSVLDLASRFGVMDRIMDRSDGSTGESDRGEPPQSG